MVDTIDQCQEMIEGCANGDLTEDVQVYRDRLNNMQDFLGTMHGLLNMVLKVKKSGLGRLAHSISRLAG